MLRRALPLLLAGALALGLAPTAPAVPAAALVPAPGARTAAAPADGCAPRPALVDAVATAEARCLAARLDRWRTARRMAVGQQLNVSSQRRLRPLDALGRRRPPVVGFDLEELARAGEHEYPSDDAVVAELLELAADGAVLVATWHARNPHTRAPDSFDDLGWRDVGALLRDTPEAEWFWADYAAKLDYLRRLQTGEDGAHPPAAVVFRPLHEANGGWFWWGQARPAVYRQLWARLQREAAEAGVHNVVWAYSANAVTSSAVRAPVALLPRAVDLAGLDSYDAELADPRDRLPLAGWGGLAGRVRRMALTEVGPYDSTDGAWRPRVVTRTVRQRGVRPLWALFWFDDPPGNRPRYLRQVASLDGWRRWWDRDCPAGRCRLR